MRHRRALTAQERERKKRVTIWMVQNEIETADIIKALGITISAVSHWKSGRLRSKRIDTWMLDNGCPRGILEK
jgi:predicted XRE-type DNA-binding protein